MALGQFPEEQSTKVFDTGEEFILGCFGGGEHREMAHMRTLLYINGVTSLAGSETLQINIYSDATLTDLMFSSTPSSISDITDIGSTNWLGWIRFDFDRENLNKNLNYYATAKVSNYTRNLDAFYMGLCFNQQNPTYSYGTTNLNAAPITFEIFGYEERT